MNADRLENNQYRSCYNYYRFDYIHKQRIIISRNGLGKTLNQTGTAQTCLFYKITQGQCSEYLTDLMPPLVSESINYNLWSSQNFTTPLSRLTLYQKSFFPATLKLWNDLDIIIRNSPSVHIFKRKLKLKYVQFPRPPTYHFTGNRNLNILHAKLRQNCSPLRSDLFRSNLIENPICSCGVGAETTEHYFLYCTKYVTARNKLENNIELINIPFVMYYLISLCRWRRKSWN
jgi:hypothetical protein